MVSNLNKILKKTVRVNFKKYIYCWYRKKSNPIILKWRNIILRVSYDTKLFSKKKNNTGVTLRIIKKPNPTICYVYSFFVFQNNIFLNRELTSWMHLLEIKFFFFFFSRQIKRFCSWKQKRNENVLNK